MEETGWKTEGHARHPAVPGVFYLEPLLILTTIQGTKSFKILILHMRKVSLNPNHLSWSGRGKVGPASLYLTTGLLSSVPILCAPSAHTSVLRTC
jgi:hypothetical protein